MDLVKRTNPFLIPFLALSLILSGCVRYRPQTQDRASFMERAQTQTDENVSATVTVLSDKEAKRVFGVNLAKKGVQPVWVEIQNKDTIPYVFIPRNMDPNYYSSEEAAYMAHFRQTRQFLEAGILAIIFFPALALIPVNFFAVRHANNKMDKTFKTLAMPSYIIMPGAKEEGFVFTSVDEGTKHVQVDLLGEREHKIFNFVATVPGIKPDYTTKDFEARYPEEKIVEYSETEIPDFLTQLPCCTTNKKGTRSGDPLNLAVIGDLEDVISLFTSSGWDETQALTFKSGFSMAKAFLTGDSDRYSPVSPLYYHGHSQDLALQKSRDTINQRLHLRLWYTPARYQGKPIWIGTISRDIGVKFTWRTWYLTTHKIDPNLDDARDYVLMDLLGNGKVAKLGFFDNIAAKESAAPKKNLTGDSYFTDGKILVIELSQEDVTPTAFPWSRFFPETSKK
ncbi:MAG TPA: LssY C-terminal domain-containing protein [Candidatus Omnitrophota bacterium]|nr:LssY C-terminal domain-containing protein [Candidatus Omnitrophota bacterium]HRY85716.1 LssY C-terminal domain-containing protein [Candidatus Omnitrophota bacterium]